MKVLGFIHLFKFIIILQQQPLPLLLTLPLLLRLHLNRLIFAPSPTTQSSCSLVLSRYGSR